MKLSRLSSPVLRPHNALFHSLPTLAFLKEICCPSFSPVCSVGRPLTPPSLFSFLTWMCFSVHWQIPRSHFSNSPDLGARSKLPRFFGAFSFTSFLFLAILPPPLSAFQFPLRPVSGFLPSPLPARPFMPPPSFLSHTFFVYASFKFASSRIPLEKPFCLLLSFPFKLPQQMMIGGFSPFEALRSQNPVPSMSFWSIVFFSLCFARGRCLSSLFPLRYCCA